MYEAGQEYYQEADIDIGIQNRTLVVSLNYLGFFIFENWLPSN